MLTDLNIHIDHRLITDALELVKTANFKTTINEPTGNFFYDPWTISEEYKNTSLEKILEFVPGPIGEARIIVLKPGTCYHSHADIDDRYHLNLTGQYSYLISLDYETMFPTIADNKLYLMDAGQRHVATNFGSVDRMQLVVRKLLNKNNLIDPISVEIVPVCNKPRFTFDDEISPWLNLINKTKLMSDFEILEFGVKFNLEKSATHQLDNFSKEKFKIIIT